MPLPSTTLTTIREKVRRITKSPSPQQISDTQLDFYVNTYYQIDMPEELRLKSLFTNHVFYTESNVESYAFPTGSNTEDGFISVEPPLYIDGYQSYYSQSQQQFYTLYPKLAITEQIGIGDGGTTNFTPTITNIPFFPEELVVTSLDANGESIVVHAQPQVPVTNPFLYDLVGDIAAGTNTVNYVTGALDVEFASAPAVNEPVNIQVAPYEPSRPVAALFYNNVFHMRPVPDAAYKVEIAAYKTPINLSSSSQSPEIEQWWQLIAMGAALKIFEDRGDLWQYHNYFPFYDQYLRLALRRTLQQQSDQRVATIYTEQAQFGYGFFNNRF